MVGMFTTRDGVLVEAAVIDISMKKVNSSDEYYHLHGFTSKVSCSTPVICHSSKNVGSVIIWSPPCRWKAVVHLMILGLHTQDSVTAFSKKQLKAKNNNRKKPQNQPERNPNKTNKMPKIQKWI